MENLMSFEGLVQLASLGTAGVCILAIFLIGFMIYKLPDNTPAWKPELLKKYINACIIIALITATSGFLNAYYNLDKVREADKATAEVVNEYEKLTAEVITIQDELVRVAQPAPHSTQPQPQVNPELLQFQPMSVEKILDSTRYQRIRSLQRVQPN